MHPNLPGYMYFQAMRFAVEEINNMSTLLPNISLGYEVYDTCYIHNNIHPALDFLSDEEVLDTKNNYTNNTPKVIAVIGPDSSDAAETTSELFNLMLIPQMNIFTTNERLSLSSLPSCFQTTPSRRIHQQGIIDILTFFNWTWIGVLGSSDNYGLHSVLHFTDAISNSDICVAYQGLIPIKVSGKEAEFRNTILQVVNSILYTKVKVIVVFSSDMVAVEFFKEVIEINILRQIWIATETWSVSKNIYTLPNINRIGVVLGIALKFVKIPGLDEYLLNVYYQQKSRSRKQDEYGNCNQQCDSCLNTTVNNFIAASEKRVSFSIYTAVYAVAHALHLVLGCNQTHCKKRNIYPWQVTDALLQVNFSLLGNQINFDQYGDSHTDLDIVFWNWWGTNPFEMIGSYTMMGNLEIRPDKIQWQTTNNLVPSSVCSNECLSGQEKKQKGTHKCCFICVSCAAGTYLSVNGTCTNCTKEQWSTERSISCFTKKRVFLSWDNTLTIVIFALSILGMLLTVLVIITFAVHLRSPVVKAAGGKMCFLMLVFLCVAYLSILAFIGEPRMLKCIMRHPIYSIALAICFSYISVRSFQLVCIFKMASTLPATYDYWVKRNGQYVCLAVLSGFQILISCIWIITNPPDTAIIDLNEHEVLLECSEFGSVANILQYSYNALLSLLCFTFAYMGKDLPKNYSEAKCITFAMLIYFVVCIFFFTAQLIDVGEYVTPINAFLALTSLQGIVGGYFFPKCYIIFCRPQFNTAQYFQTTIQSYTKRESGGSR
ncbi:taste receptor type 1 member 2 [Bombina bombina]|uniref:taste receptor type 1 member 2 n=1 Tax=Bombina bombina TaxID=8345 RepID=UPI00235AA3B1|nr:taste receptor type 1 member 2 [Bombina bombina]